MAHAELDDAAAHPGAASAPPIVGTLAPIMAVVLVAYLVIGVAIPVLPLYVHQELGLGTFLVGLAAGVQFAAALVSRFWSGRYADTRGAKRAVVAGLLLGIGAGLLYLASLRVAHAPAAALAVLLLGRVLLGGAESFVITGALSWALALGGPRNTGKVISWVGTALWGAYAAGAPAGTALYGRFGFTGIALATVLLPLATLLLVAPLRALAPSAQASPPFTRVVGAVWVPGMGAALTAVGFGALTTFGALLFAERGWGAAWLAFTALSVSFILGRVLFGHLPDRLGGARVALVCVLVETIGMAMIWLAPSRAVVFAGAAVTGAGYSLVYPGFGIEAVRRAPAETRGLAMGAYTAFLDLSLGVASPVLGLVATRAGLRAVFFVSTLVVLGGAAVAVRLLPPKAGA
jgi:MFS family permease